MCDGYRVERLVRQDSGCETYNVTGKGGQVGLAHVLFLRVRDRSLMRWKHEITAVNRVSHAAVPRTIAGGATEAGRALIVTERVAGESLDELRRAWDGHLPGVTAIPYVCEVLEALEAAHARGVVHGALRPRSVYVDPERIGTHISIADFGYSRLFEESHRRGRSVSDTAVASNTFLAPEQRDGGYVADARTDIFSAACLVLYLLGQDMIGLMATESPSAGNARQKLIHDCVKSAALPASIGDALVRALHPSRPERQAAARVLLEELRTGLAQVAEVAPRYSEPATADDPPTIATIAELQRVLIEEARLSMGATDTGVDPLAVPRVETPFHEQQQPREETPAAAEARSDTNPPSSEAHVVVPLPGNLFQPHADNTRSIVTSAPTMEILRAAVASPIGDAAPRATTPSRTEPVPAPAPTQPAARAATTEPVRQAVSVGSGKSERPLATDDRVSEESVRQHVGGLLAGRYVLDRPLASGGMATVYLGCLVEAGMARTVAIKRVHPSLAVDARCAAMMLDEARMASRISHPNVVPILDVIREADEIMLVLEYVHGVTASQLAREGTSQAPIPASIASAIVVGALRGLDAAHAATDVGGRPMGLVHRDISPQNIMVGLDGGARVIDFGIARALGRAEVTTGTELRGKVAYMAPERLRGQKTDLRVDLWSAGVVLWELVSGTKLFQADDPIEAAVKVCTGSIPQTGNDALDGVLERALARDLEERYRTAGEMADALQQAVPPAAPAEVSAYLKDGCARLLDAQSAALASLKSRIEKGNLPEPSLPKLRTPMGFAAARPVVTEAPRAAPAPAPSPEPPAPPPAQAPAAVRATAPSTPENEADDSSVILLPPSTRIEMATEPPNAPKIELADVPPHARSSGRMLTADTGPISPASLSGPHSASASGAFPVVGEKPASAGMGIFVAVIAVLVVVAFVLVLFLVVLSGN